MLTFSWNFRHFQDGLQCLQEQIFSVVNASCRHLGFAIEDSGRIVGLDSEKSPHQHVALKRHSACLTGDRDIHVVPSDWAVEDSDYYDDVAFEPMSFDSGKEAEAYW